MARDKGVSEMKAITAKSFKAGHVYRYREVGQRFTTFVLCDDVAVHPHLIEIGESYRSYNFAVNGSVKVEELTDITAEVLKIRSRK